MTNSTERDYLAELVQILARLRAPQGCPWDRKQTHETLKRYLIEECGELLDAIDDGDDAGMVEELGDVLLQIVFHAQIGAEEGHFDLQDVARSECEKMIRRHPHVFAGAAVEDVAGVRDQWEAIKRAEKGDAVPASAVHGVPRHLPALHRAQRLQGKAAKVGFAWPGVADAMTKLREELAEVEAAMVEGNREAVAEELGDTLFALVNVCRYEGFEAEDLLQGAIRKFESRFRAMEESLADQGMQVENSAGADLLAEWQRAKERLAPREE